MLPHRFWLLPAISGVSCPEATSSNLCFHFTSYSPQPLYLPESNSPICEDTSLMTLFDPKPHLNLIAYTKTLVTKKLVVVGVFLCPVQSCSCSVPSKNTDIYITY